MIFDDSDRPPEAEPDSSMEPDQEPASAQAPELALSPAETRFKACRWHAKDDDLEYCSNRDVLPYAGKHAFNSEAWCPDCKMYKLRRTPKKRDRPYGDDYEAY